MNKINKNLYEDKSLLGSYWNIHELDERLVLSSSQKNHITPLLAKFLLIRNIDTLETNEYLNSNIKDHQPNPFLLKDMLKATERAILSIKKNEKIGIICDYDVDGSTSAAILYKFLSNFSNEIIIMTPNRLSEGYGPNLRIMDDMLSEKVKLVFTLDCGTSSFNIIDNNKYSNIDIIVIDHHLSEAKLPNVFAVINPNRVDEESEFKYMAAVGVTFLFLMALRKNLRQNKFFNIKKEPNLLLYLDLVALGTVCDVVSLVNYNRLFVKMGLNLIKQRKNLGITKIIDNSNLQETPTSSDLGFVIGPQLNAASRIDDSSLASKILISNDLSDVENISRKLNLLNEKRKLIEKSIFDEAVNQAISQKDRNFILVYGENWHNGVLGIIASKLINKFNKPSIVISFTNSLGVGSARSINSIDLGNIILNAKNNNILISGGGHKMAAGLSIKLDNLEDFNFFLEKSLNTLPINYFDKNTYYDCEISSNQINDELLDLIDLMEPFGSGNPEPKFIIKDFLIDSFKILKDRHLLIFFKNDYSIRFKAICFNCIDTPLGEYIINYKRYKFAFGCCIKRDSFSENSSPQIIINDAMIIN